MSESSSDSEGSAAAPAPAPAAAAASDDSAAAVDDLRCVWDGGKFVNETDTHGKKIMKCLHGCGGVWKSWNHTKALGHVLGGCSDIKQCRFVTKSWREKYQGIRNLTAQRRQEKADAVAQMNMDCDELEEMVIERHSHSRSGRSAFVTAAAAAAPRASQASFATASTLPSDSDEGGGMVSLGSRHHVSTPSSAVQHSAATKRALSNVFLQKLGHGSNKKKKHYHQTALVTSIGKNSSRAKEELDVAISHMIHACGLPFTLADDILFHRMLLRARDVNASYKPPASYEISGHLLDSTFSTYYDDGKEKLLREAEVFGIAIGGDGATIDKCPLFNAIACSPSNPSMVLDVFDCSEHAAAGKKKDAAFILRTMLPKMEEIDPQKKYIDLITFDGAGNVQNAAKLLAIHFPRASIGPAVEHVVSLMFDKVMRLRPISELCHIAKWVSDCIAYVFCTRALTLHLFLCRYAIYLERRGMLLAPITSRSLR